MTDKDFLVEACNEAETGMNSNHGGPFGAVIVVDGKIVGRGHNRVTSTNDPTAHAEVNAIRDACTNLDKFHLENATIYTNCEPCPMCLSAIYWANIDKIYYASDKKDAEDIGFDDNFIYAELSLPVNQRSIEMKRLAEPLAIKVFNGWKEKADKTEY